MNCFDFKKHIEDFADGDAGDGLKGAMEAHMEECPVCRREYEDTKYMVDCLRKDASTAILTEKQRIGIKETILRAPVKKSGRHSSFARNLLYTAAIFMFIAAGLYFAGEININIGPAASTDDGSLKARMEVLTRENYQLKITNEELKTDKAEIERQNQSLRTDAEGMREELAVDDWLMVNYSLGEAMIEGTVTSVDSEAGKIMLNIYRDDNTPDIDPDILIPDGIFVTRPVEGEEDRYNTRPGSVDNLKPGDYVIIHYIGSLKSARAVLILK